MAYYFMISNKEGYKSIDLNIHPCFNRISKFNGDKYSLEEIDNFTSSFANELALRESLWYNWLLNENEVFKQIFILYKDKGYFKRVKYNLVFQDASKYLNPVFLNYMLKSLFQDNCFVNRFLSYYGNSIVNSDIVCAIREYTFGNPELDIYNLIDEFLNREIYNRKYNYKTMSYEYLSIKYKPLHDLAMFVYNYVEKPQMSKSEINVELKKFIDYFKNVWENKPQVVKSKKKGLEGQLSFFD